MNSLFFLNRSLIKIPDEDKDSFEKSSILIPIDLPLLKVHF